LTLEGGERILGLATLNNGWKRHLGNFLVTLGAQVVFQLVQTVPQNELPTSAQLFWAVVNAAAVSFSFYGINKLTTPKEGA